MPEASVPESSRLPSDYEVKSPSTEVRLEFWELAKSRVRFITPEEMLAIHTQVGKLEEFYPGKIAFAIVSKRVDEEIDIKDKLLSTIKMIQRRKSLKSTLTGIVTPEQTKWIDALEIYINKQAFSINGQDYSDIIPYVIEHEIYERWAKDKQGFVPNPNQAHLLARRHEFRIAVQDGKADRLLEFIKVATPADLPDAEEAYKASVRKNQDG